MVIYINFIYLFFQSLFHCAFLACFRQEYKGILQFILSKAHSCSSSIQPEYRGKAMYSIHWIIPIQWIVNVVQCKKHRSTGFS